MKQKLIDIGKTFKALHKDFKAELKHDHYLAVSYQGLDFGVYYSSYRERIEVSASQYRSKIDTSYWIAPKCDRINMSATKDIDKIISDIKRRFLTDENIKEMSEAKKAIENYDIRELAKRDGLNQARKLLNLGEYNTGYIDKTDTIYCRLDSYSSGFSLELQNITVDQIAKIKEALNV